MNAKHFLPVHGLYRGSGMIYNEAGYRLRLQIEKLVRTNLTIDFGMGTDHSGGIYFNLS